MKRKTVFCLLVGALLIIVIIVPLLSACGGQKPAPEPVPEPEPEPAPVPEALETEEVPLISCEPGDGADCLQCHESGEEGVPVMLENHLGFQNDVCRTCHEE